MLHRILDALYFHKKAGPIFLALNMHHDFSRPMKDTPLKEVMEWDAWQLQNPPTLTNTLILALKIVGRRFHYEHQFKELLKLAKEADPSVDENLLGVEFAASVTANEKDGEESREESRFHDNVDAAIAIHGDKANNWFKRKTPE